MNLNQICVSLELAKELKEAGYKQDSLFWWNFYSPGAMDEELVRTAYGRYKLENIGQDSEESIAAPTASELLEQLPKDIAFYHWRWESGQYNFGFENDNGGEENFGEDTLVDAIAKCWLYTIKRAGTW